MAQGLGLLSPPRRRVDKIREAGVLYLLPPVAFWLADVADGKPQAIPERLGFPLHRGASEKPPGEAPDLYRPQRAVGRLEPKWLRHPSPSLSLSLSVSLYLCLCLCVSLFLCLRLSLFLSLSLSLYQSVSVPLSLSLSVSRSGLSMPARRTHGGL